MKCKLYGHSPHVDVDRRWTTAHFALTPEPEIRSKALLAHLARHTPGDGERDVADAQLGALLDVARGVQRQLSVQLIPRVVHIRAARVIDARDLAEDGRSAASPHRIRQEYAKLSRLVLEAAARAELEEPITGIRIQRLYTGINAWH